MARVLLFVRIMPSDSEINVDELGRKIASSLPEGFAIQSISKEPLAFGMQSLLIAFSVPDEEGASSRLEDYLSSFSEVGEINVEGLTRMRD